MKRIFLSVFIVITTFYQIRAQVEKVQAAYIYQFTKLIEWCAEKRTGDFTISVLGSAAITANLTGLNGKTVGSQKIVVKTFANISEIDNCNILFIPMAKSGQLGAVNNKISNSCTLVITEKSGLAKSGSSINFIEVDGKIVFEVSNEAMSKHSLTASAKLLSLAKTVY